MPLGDYNKEQVREIARGLDLRTANKPESQEICFVEDNNYGRFISERKGEKIKPGLFVDAKGNKLGTHKGIAHYTVGQRKGLGIALGKPMFVVELIPEKNLVVLGDESEVFSRELTASQMNFITFEKLEESIAVKAKIRYSAKEAEAKVIPLSEDRVKVVFEEPQRAITPGQAVVFYQDEVLVGGGTIER
jgi:tRNA-specific 2-thiouridylase